LPKKDLALILAATKADVVATAPLVVFAAANERRDAARAASLAWPKACAVIEARSDIGSGELVDRVLAELRWAGIERQPHACSEGSLRPWLGLEATAPTCFLHVARDAYACGTDLVVECFARHFAGCGMRLRLVMPTASPATIHELLDRAAAAADLIDVVRAPFTPAHARDAAAIVQPYRRLEASDALVFALASGRPVVAARFDATARLLAGDAVAVAVGGRHVGRGSGDGGYFAPDPMGLYVAWKEAFGQRSAPGVGERARRHVVAELLKGRPVPPPPPVRSVGVSLPKVVLEAPFFGGSASAEAAIATARALVAREDIDVHLVPNAPSRRQLAWLRSHAPELEAKMTRNPGRADLWLSSGWPSRADRPDCRRWALQLDRADDLAPHELPASVTQEADHVYVQSERSYRSVTASGRAEGSVTAVPHGAAAATCLVASMMTLTRAAVRAGSARPRAVEPTVSMPLPQRRSTKPAMGRDRVLEPLKA